MKHITELHLSQLVERVSRKYGEKRWFITSVFALVTMTLATLVTGKFTMFRSTLIYRPFQISEIFHSKLVDIRKPLVSQICRHLAGQALTRFPQSKEIRIDFSWLHKRRPCEQNESCPTGTCPLPRLRFIHSFTSVVKQMSGYNMERRTTAHNLPMLRFHHDLVFL